MISLLSKNLHRILFLFAVIGSSVYIETFKISLGQYINLQLILIFLLRLISKQNFQSLWFLMIMSIFNDVLNGLLFGTSAILYLVIHSFASFQASIKLRSVFISEWIAFSVSLLVAYIFLFGLDYLANLQYNFSLIGINFILTVLFYPVAWIIIGKLFYKNA